MTGNWPQEWDDPDDDFLGEDGDLGADSAELAEVSAWLAAAPAPVLPAAVQARITAALAAESGAARPDDSSRRRRPGPRVLGRAPDRARVRRRPRWGPILSTMSGTLVVCLLIAGLGFALSRGGGASSSSAPAAAPGITNGIITAGPAAGSASRAGSSGGEFSGESQSSRVAVTTSGTRYEQATLAAQVRAREKAFGMLALGPAAPAASSAGSPKAPAASASATTAPLTKALRGCVTALTAGAEPVLVDRATYDGTPAYVIATTNYVWVVGLDCTAANARVITSEPLAS